MRVQAPNRSKLVEELPSLNLTVSVWIQYQILLHGCWYEVFGGDPDNFPTELDGRNQDALTQPLLAEESLMVHRSPSYNTLEDEPHLNSPPQYPRLYLPGKIIHIVEESSSRR